MEQVRRWREPVAIALLVVAGIRLLIGTVAVPVLAGDDAYGSFATAAMFEADRSFDLLLTLATAAAAASCLLSPATPRARGVVVAAVIETLAGILVALGFGLMGLGSSSPGRGIEFGFLLLGLALPVVAVLGLVSMLRSTSPSVSLSSAAADGGAELSADRSSTGSGSTEHHPPAAPPALPAAWLPEQATGRVWQTAEDAARGAPGVGWSDDGGAGWQPIPGSTQPGRTEPPAS